MLGLLAPWEVKVLDSSRVIYCNVRTFFKVSSRVDLTITFDHVKFKQIFDSQLKLWTDLRAEDIQLANLFLVLSTDINAGKLDDKYKPSEKSTCF